MQHEPHVNRPALIFIITGTLLASFIGFRAYAARAATTALPFLYTFNAAGVVNEAATPAQSWSPYLWLASGGRLVIAQGEGATIRGALSSADPLRARYANTLSISSDGGAHPQNTFLLFAKAPVQDADASVFIDRAADNLGNAANRHPYDGESLIVRWQDPETFYMATLRDDGTAVIKKRAAGTYATLASARLFLGTYDAQTNPDLIPKDEWIGMRVVAIDSATSTTLDFYTDIGKTGVWKLAARASDGSARIAKPGLVGIESDYADVSFERFSIADATPPSPMAAVASYDSLVLSAHPALYLPMAASSSVETDLSGHGLSGTYEGGMPKPATLPNGDSAADFNGSSEYLSVPSDPSFSIQTGTQLTYEAWIRPDTFAFAKASSDGYVDWMGKCETYSPNCEWEARLYGNSTPEGRDDRLSGYVFNPGAGMGSAADWQPAPGVLSAGQWIHIVAEYDTTHTPAACDPRYPGTVNIWVDGVEQSFADHAPTGCMSQYGVAPKAGDSPLTVGTMALDTWFPGAVGKVAIYDRLLSPAEITDHFKAMTGRTPAGSCADTCTLSK